MPPGKAPHERRRTDNSSRGDGARDALPAHGIGDPFPGLPGRDGDLRIMLLTLSIFIPLIGAVLVLLVPDRNRAAVRWISLLSTVAAFAVILAITLGYRKDGGEGVAEKLSAVRAERLATLGAEDRAFVESLGARAPAEARTAIAQRFAPLRNTPDGAGRESRSVAVWQECWELAAASRSALTRNLRYAEYVSWIDAFNIRYFLAVDGLSLPMLFLTGLLGVICIIYSWKIDKGTKGYMALFLLLQTGLTGVFLALDFFLFYVFWEIVLLPMYFLIGIWGGPNRIYAAIKFFIYTLVGSVVMLIAMLALYFHGDMHSFNVLALVEAAGTGQFDPGFQKWIFLALFLGFAIKVPVFPFHTWLPDAHVEAPTAASVILAGVLLKMGGYGFFRFSYPMAPEIARSETFVLFIGVLGLINIIYGALCAMAQKDFKKLVAYSSISHMGYVLLGLAALTPAGVNGAALQMFNHGLSSAMMFLLVGVIYDRAHHREIDRFGGIWVAMPKYTGLAIVGFFASLGLPGLNGFISEALVFLGAWQSDTLHAATPAVFGLPRWIVYAAIPGIVLTAAYILWTVQRVYMGKLDARYAEFPDADRREWLSLAPLGALCILFGVFPSLILKVMDGSLQSMLLSVTGAR